MALGLVSDDDNFLMARFSSCKTALNLWYLPKGIKNKPSSKNESFTALAGF